GRSLVGGHVVAGEEARQLVVAQRLEVASGSQVAGPPGSLGAGAVGDFADERLDEPVLAALRRAGVNLEVEQLAPDEGLEARLELGLIVPGHGAETGHAARLAEDRSIGNQGAVGRVERMEG